MTRPGPKVLIGVVPENTIASLANVEQNINIVAMQPERIVVVEWAIAYSNATPLWEQRLTSVGVNATAVLHLLPDIAVSRAAVPAALLFSTVLDQTFDAIWLLDANIALKQFQFQEFLWRWRCLSSRFPPLVAQPLLLQHDMDFWSVDWHFWQRSRLDQNNVNASCVHATTTNFVTMQATLIDASFFMWFTDRFIPEMATWDDAHFSDWGLSAILCRAARVYFAPRIPCALLHLPIQNAVQTTAPRHDGFYYSSLRFLRIVRQRWPDWYEDPMDYAYAHSKYMQTLSDIEGGVLGKVPGVMSAANLASGAPQSVNRSNSMWLWQVLNWRQREAMSSMQPVHAECHGSLIGLNDMAGRCTPHQSKVTPKAARAVAIDGLQVYRVGTSSSSTEHSRALRHLRAIHQAALAAINTAERFALVLEGSVRQAHAHRWTFTIRELIELAPKKWRIIQFHLEAARLSQWCNRSEPFVPWSKFASTSSPTGYLISREGMHRVLTASGYPAELKIPSVDALSMEQIVFASQVPFSWSFTRPLFNSLPSSEVEQMTRFSEWFFSPSLALEKCASLERAVRSPLNSNELRWQVLPWQPTADERELCSGEKKPKGCLYLKHRTWCMRWLKIYALETFHRTWNFHPLDDQFCSRTFMNSFREGRFVMGHTFSTS